MNKDVNIPGGDSRCLRLVSPTTRLLRKNKATLTVLENLAMKYNNDLETSFSHPISVQDSTVANSHNQSLYDTVSMALAYSVKERDDLHAGLNS